MSGKKVIEATLETLIQRSVSMIIVLDAKILGNRDVRAPDPGVRIRIIYHSAIRPLLQFILKSILFLATDVLSECEQFRSCKKARNHV